MVIFHPGNLNILIIIPNQKKMELNLSFVTGLGCGICIGISLFALKKYFKAFSETAEAVKKVLVRLYK